MLVHQGPIRTQERYEGAVRRLTGGRSRLEKPSDRPVDGLLVHVAGRPDGFRVVGVWESEDAVRRFGEQLASTLQEVGVTERPQVYPAHTFVSA